MILSLKPPYEIATEIFKLITKISKKLVEVKALHMDKPSSLLRKRNKIKTIHSSLNIEEFSRKNYMEIFEEVLLGPSVFNHDEGVLVN